MEAFQAEEPIEDIRIIPQIEDTNWHQKTACAGSGEDFYPEGRPGRPRQDGAEQTSEADRLIGTYCMNCVVREDCLTNSIFMKDSWGIQGGLDEDERRPLISAYHKTGTVPLELWERRHVIGSSADQSNPEQHVSLTDLETQPGPAASPAIPKPRQPHRETATDTPSTSKDEPSAVQPENDQGSEHIPDLPEESGHVAFSAASLRARIRARQLTLSDLRKYPKDETKEQRRTITAEIAAMSAILSQSA
jgi:hypothetical protein